MPQAKQSYHRFKGKTALVTGAGAISGGIGVGRAIALAFASEGARVCLMDLDTDAANETLSMIEAQGGEAMVATGDAADQQQGRQCVETMLAAYGRIDVLVNNVGVSGGVTPLTAIDMADWSRTFDTNIMSAVLMSRHAIPAMIEQGGGSIVNISSIAGFRSMGATAYGASKAAMIQFTRDIAVLHGRQRIRANVIAPGHLWTPMASTASGDDKRELRRKIAPLGVEGDAWDIADAALFLASDEARFITGVLLPVDGGATVMTGLTAHIMVGMG